MTDILGRDIIVVDILMAILHWRLQESAGVI